MVYYHETFCKPPVYDNIFNLDNEILNLVKIKNMKNFLMNLLK